MNLSMIFGGIIKVLTTRGRETYKERCLKLELKFEDDEELDNVFYT